MNEISIEELKKLNLYEKINLICEEIKGIAKNTNVSTGKSSYKAVSEKDVKEAVRKAEIKFRVASIPFFEYIKMNESEARPTQYNKDATGLRCEVKCELTLVNIDNTEEKHLVSGFGTGIDTGDKGWGKASTYALKYCLMNAYKIPTGDDPDFEASPEYDKPQTQKAQQVPKKPQKNAVKEEFKQLANEYSTRNNVALKDIFSEFNITGNSTDEEIAQATMTLKQVLF